MEKQLRNPTAEELQRYEELKLDLEESKLEARELMVELRKKYTLPESISVDDDGYFTIGGGQQGQPMSRYKNLRPAQGEIEALLKAGIKAADLENRLARCILELHRACCSPLQSQLDDFGRWVTRGGRKLVDEQEQNTKGAEN